MLLKDLLTIAFRGALEFTYARDLFVKGTLAARAIEFPKGDVNEQGKPGELTMSDLPAFGFLDATGVATAIAADSLTMKDCMGMQGIWLTKLTKHFATVESNDSLTEQHGESFQCVDSLFDRNHLSTLDPHAPSFWVV